ncbi:MAG: (5-formylfuran-3-yl)methyl phosphate synthase, partial [Rubrivivax sp.]
MRLLISVRSVDEALLAARGGAGLIDLKEPRNGALGALSPALQLAICEALKAEGCTLPVSATIGDLPLSDLPAVREQVVAVAASGVDYVKVGIEAGANAAPALRMLATALASTLATKQVAV